MATKDIYERIARWYDALDWLSEVSRYRPIRREMFAGLSGRLLDAGVGTGRNMPFYPAGGEVVGIDLSPAMLRRAATRRASLGAVVELREMDVCATGFPDDHFDAVVATFLFCVLDDSLQRPALRELARICKPGGEIRLLDYTLPEDPLRRFVMGLTAPYVRWIYGADLNRDTERHIADAPLRLVDRRFVYRDVIRLLVLTPAA